MILLLDIENTLHKETKLQCIKMVDLGPLPLWVIRSDYIMYKLVFRTATPPQALACT